MTALPAGTAHTLPADLRAELLRSKRAQATWHDITPLARNEWICWTISVQKKETRREHVQRAIEELSEGKRRPCCWSGCIHRKDKEMNRSQKYLESKKRSPKR